MKKINVLIGLLILLLTSCTITEKTGESNLDISNEVTTSISMPNSDIESDNIVKIDENEEVLISEYIFGDYTIEPLLNDLINVPERPELRLIYEDDTMAYYFVHKINGPEDIVVTDRLFNSILNRITIDEELSLPEAYTDSNGKLVFRCQTDSGYDIYNDVFEKIDTWTLPEDVLNLKKDHMIRDWDANKEYSLIAYTSDSLGLELYDSICNKVRHIADNDMTLEEIESLEAYGDVYAYVEFISYDRYLSIQRNGYESINGFDLYNIESGNLTALNGSFDFEYYDNLGCYIFEDQGIKATIYDFDQDKRISRGIQGKFAMSQYGQGFNDMIEIYLVSASDEYTQKNMEIFITNIRSNVSKKLIEVKKDEDTERVPKVIGRIGDRLLIYCDWIPQHKLFSVPIPSI